MTPPPSTAGTGPGLALVVFTGEADLKWLNVLKPGFRHCFAALESGSRWVIYNPLSHRTEIIVVGTEDVFRLTHYYREQGLDMVPWVTQPPPSQTGALGPLYLRRGDKKGAGNPHPTGYNTLESL